MSHLATHYHQELTYYHKCKTPLPTRASCLNANATTWSYPTTTATTNNINTTNNIDTCDLNLNPVKTTISKSHNLSGRHINVDIDASNAQSLYTPPPDASTSYDSTDPTDFADHYPPTSATFDHHTNANTAPPLRRDDSIPLEPQADQVLTPQQRITRSLIAAAQRRHTVRI